LEAAAGMVGLVKIILAMQNRIIPPHLHFTTPNPLIPWDQLPIEVPTQPTPWQPSDDRPLVAALSSFGFSGTNAHIIIEQPPAPVTTASPVAQTPVVLTQSGRSARALQDIATRTFAYMTDQPDTPLSRIAFSAN